MSVTKLPESLMSRVYVVAEAASVKDDDFAAKLHDLMHECCALQSEKDYSTSKPLIPKNERHALIVPQLPNYKDNPKQESLLS